MARVLMIFQFLFGLLLASAGVGICIHAAVSDVIPPERFHPYMITGWVCLGVGLVVLLATTRRARLREQMLFKSEHPGKE